MDFLTHGGTAVESTQINNLPESGFLRLHQIIGDRQKPGLIPISRSAWYAGVEQGRFPKPVKIGPRASAYRVADIRRLIDELSEGAGE